MAVLASAVRFATVLLMTVLFTAERFATGALTVVFCTDTFNVTGEPISVGAAVVFTIWVVGAGVATCVATVVVGVTAGGVEVHPALIMTTATIRTSKSEDILIHLMQISPA